MDKLLSNVVMFLCGAASQKIPTRVFFTYDVVKGAGCKDGLVYEIPSLDPDKTVSVIWEEGVKAIKAIEELN